MPKAVWTYVALMVAVAPTAAAEKGDKKVAPALSFKMKTIDGKAAAYVCENFTCKAPVTEAKALGELLR